MIKVFVVKLTMHIWLLENRFVVLLIFKNATTVTKNTFITHSVSNQLKFHRFEIRGYRRGYKGY